MCKGLKSALTSENVYASREKRSRETRTNDFMLSRLFLKNLNSYKSIKRSREEEMSYFI